MARKTLSLTSTATALLSFISAHEDAKSGREGMRYISDQEYQRGLVWGQDRKKNLIFSILSGVPIGAIIVNDRFANADAFRAAGYDSEVYAIIDGKQRVSTIIEFYENGFSVPAEWFDDDDIEAHARGNAEVYYRDLTKGAQSDFRTTGVPVSFATVASVKEEQELFDLVNFGGVAQGETDL